MKLHILIIATLLFAGMINVIPADIATAVTERGPHHRAVETTLTEKVPNGPVQERKAVTVEIATGLHYVENGDWKESRELIEPVAGGAGAYYGQIKAAFAANINTWGSVQLVDSDGKQFTSHLLGLAWTDAGSGKSVMFAEIKDSVGELVGDNVIIYKDAFTGCKIDVRYTYRRYGFEQDLILLEAISPAEYGLDPDTTRLEVYTEFIAAPEAALTTKVLASETDPQRRAAMALPDFVDQTLHFSALSMREGSVFALDGSSEPVTTGKTWEIRDGRRFLIEAVQFRSVAGVLQRLPQRQAKLEGNKAMASLGKGVGRALLKYPTPPRQATARDNQPMRHAALPKIGPAKGLVLDFLLTINGGLTNFTFIPEYTHSVTGPVNLYGTTTIGGSTIVKFGSESANSYLSFNDTVVCNTTMWHPAVFTAKHDATMGDSVAVGAISGYYAVTALRSSGVVTGDLHNLRISYAKTAIDWSGSSRISDIQLINCSNGIRRASVTNAPIHNLLATNVQYLFVATNASVDAQHVTAHRVGTLESFTGTPSTLTLTNCILVNITNLGSGTLAADYIATNTTPSISLSHSFAPTAPIFTNIVGGHYYLFPSSSLVDAGTTNIATNLLAELAFETTDPPTYLANTTLGTSTFSRVAQRDTNTPNIGFHYAPVDYLVTGVALSTNTLLTISDGTTLAIDYGGSSWGLTFDSAKLLSVGSPLKPNRIIRSHCVQEISSGNPGTRAMFYDLGADGHAHGPSDVRFRFTEFNNMAGDGYAIYTGDNFGAWEWSHCNLYTIPVVFSLAKAGQLCGLTNSIFEWGTGIFYSSGSTAIVHCRNNLFRQYNLSLNGTNTWTLRDNLFDTRLLTDNGHAVTSSHNGYFNITNQLSGGSNDVVLTNLVYQAGPLGPYYYKTNSSLINTGSRTADLASLYHFTTLTNQVKETNTTVDIGFHYVAVDATGLPLDTDADGIADYIEDADGNGTVGSGETDWNDPFDFGLRVRITYPR